MIATTAIPTIPPLAGRIAVFLVATLLLHGFLFHSKTRRMLKMPHHTHRSSSARRCRPSVQVKVLAESLCIDCKRFFTQQLSQAYETLGASVIDLQVIPFGNAQYVQRNQTTEEQQQQQQVVVLKCQHGDAECDANSYQQCVTLELMYPYPQRYLPFLTCLYETLDMGYKDEPFPKSIFAECARQSALDWEGIAACHDNEAHAAVLQQMAYALTPDYHTFVPWVEINGKHVRVDNDDDDSFLRAVCQEYTSRGGKHPACSVMPF